jgi:hypothetical protein
MSLVGWIISILLVSGALTAVLLSFRTYHRSRKLAINTIRAKLTALSVDPSGVSDDSMAALAAHSIKSAKFEALISPAPWPDTVQGHAEVTAVLVAEIVSGKGEFSADRIIRQCQMGTAPVEWRILAKHQPERFALEKLEAAQSAVTASSLRREMMVL